MEISDKQLYDYCYVFSNHLITKFVRFGGKAQLDAGVKLLKEAKENQWDNKSLREALSYFKSASKLLKDESKVAAYLNACLCCYYLKDKEQFLIYKKGLSELVFPEETRKYIKDLGSDPTGFKTIFRIIKSLCTGTEYKNGTTLAKEAEDLFMDNKKKALEIIESLRL